MIIDCGINSDFNVISSQGVESINVDDVCFHVDDMNAVGKGVEVL